jgi:hypothetical protein
MYKLKMSKPLRRVICAAFLMLLGQVSAYAQTPGATNYLSFTANQTMAFPLNTTALLESAQSISNAFYLKVESAYGGHIYVSATVSTSTSTPMPVSDLILTFYSTTNSATYYTSLNTADIPLSGSNQLLFQAKPKATAYNYDYSVKIPAIGYAYLPGTYTFTLTFTMTEP